MKMRVLRESWCFCNGGGGKSERMKATIFSGKAPAMVRTVTGGIGFLIHRNLLLTTHANLPSVAAAEAAEIRLHSGVAASLFPHRFFITSSVLDLTLVGLDAMDENAQLQQPHYLKTCSKPNLDLGSIVYLLGHTEKNELVVGEGKVVIATDNLIKLSTDGVTWSPGSAGFDIHGNLAFMICDPMKLATSPNTKSTSTSTSSSSSLKKDHPTQFGIPIPIICDWLNQHWEGNLDDLNKPKLPIIRLMSSSQKSDHSCASFTMRQIFKSMEAENEGMVKQLNTLSKSPEQPGPSSSAIIDTPEDNRNLTSDPPAATYMQGIPPPKIYDSPIFTSVPVKKKETSQIQLLDINFPPRITKPIVSSQAAKRVLLNSDHIYGKEPPRRQPFREEQSSNRGQTVPMEDADVASTGSINGVQSEVQSSSSPIELQRKQNEYSSDGETTMYSAETAESRNYPSPKEDRYKAVGRTQSCVNYSRWGPSQRNPVARRTTSEYQRSIMQERKVYSQGATSQRSNDYYTPTVASRMKKRNSTEPPNRRARQSAVHSSPRWAF